MIARFFTLAARAQLHQLVAVLVCCCCVGRGEVGIAAVLPLAPASESAEREQAPSESAPEAGEAAWAAPRGRDVRQLGLHFAGVGLISADVGNAWLRPRQSPGTASAGRFEHARRSGLGAPLRI